MKKLLYILLLLFCSICLADRTDNFNRADAPSSINPPSDSGSNWVVQSASCTGSVLSNMGRMNPSASQCTIVMDAGFNNMSVQTTISAGNTADIGIVSRAVDDNNYILMVTTSGSLKIYKRVSGSFTQLSSDNGVVNNGDVVKLNSDSSNQHTGYVNGSNRPNLTITESANSTGTKGGIRDNNVATGRFDDFSITCLSSCGGGAAPPKLQLMGIGP